MTLKAAFAARLNQAMTAKGMGYRCATKLANKIGVTHKCANRWLKGETVPLRDHIASIAAFLDVTPLWLEFGSNYTKTPEEYETEIADLKAEIEALKAQLKPVKKVA